LPTPSRGKSKRQTVHGESHIKGFLDTGSIPVASTKKRTDTQSGVCSSSVCDLNHHSLRRRKAAAEEGVGEQVKTPRCGVFTQRYPTKQGVCRAEQAQATADDYATGEDPSNPTKAAGVSPASEGREKTGRRGRRPPTIVTRKMDSYFSSF